MADSSEEDQSVQFLLRNFKAKVSDAHFCPEVVSKKNQRRSLGVRRRSSVVGGSPRTLLQRVQEEKHKRRSSFVPHDLLHHKVLKQREGSLEASREKDVYEMHSTDDEAVGTSHNLKSMRSSSKKLKQSTSRAHKMSSPDLSLSSDAEQPPMISHVVPIETMLSPKGLSSSQAEQQIGVQRSSKAYRGSGIKANKRKSSIPISNLEKHSTPKSALNYDLEASLSHRAVASSKKNLMGSSPVSSWKEESESEKGNADIESNSTWGRKEAVKRNKRTKHLLSERKGESSRVNNSFLQASSSSEESFTDDVGSPLDMEVEEASSAKNRSTGLEFLSNSRSMIAQVQSKLNAKDHQGATSVSRVAETSMSRSEKHLSAASKNRTSTKDRLDVTFVSNQPEDAASPVRDRNTSTTSKNKLDRIDRRDITSVSNQTKAFMSRSTEKNMSAASERRSYTEGRRDAAYVSDEADSVTSTSRDKNLSISSWNKVDDRRDRRDLTFVSNQPEAAASPVRDQNTSTTSKSKLDRMDRRDITSASNQAKASMSRITDINLSATSQKRSYIEGRLDATFISNQQDVVASPSRGKILSSTSKNRLDRKYHQEASQANSSISRSAGKNLSVSNQKGLHAEDWQEASNQVGTFMSPSSDEESEMSLGAEAASYNANRSKDKTRSHAKSHKISTQQVASMRKQYSNRSVDSQQNQKHLSKHFSESGNKKASLTENESPVSSTLKPDAYIGSGKKHKSKYPLAADRAKHVSSSPAHALHETLPSNSRKKRSTSNELSPFEFDLGMPSTSKLPLFKKMHSTPFKGGFTEKLKNISLDISSLKGSDGSVAAPITAGKVQEEKNGIEEDELEVEAEEQVAGPSASVRKQPKRTTKTTKRLPKEEGKPIMPRMMTKGIFQHFAQMPVDHSSMPLLDECVNQFFKNTLDTLMAYAEHAGRTFIDKSDVEVLLFRLRWCTDRNSLNALIEQYLSRDLRSELIPRARSVLAEKHGKR